MNTVYKLYNKVFYKILQIVISKNPIFFSKNFKVLYAKYIYFRFTREYLNLRNPKNLNEKLTWLKLYYTNPLIPKCTDKYDVREYIEQKGASEILNELYHLYYNVDEINFEELPNQFALKATHGCGYNIICENKSKLDIEDAKVRLNKWMNTVYGMEYGEWHYADIMPKIICEKFLPHPENSTSVLDYKIFCFNGNPDFFIVYKNRAGSQKMRSTYNLKWERLNYLKHEGDSVSQPKNLDLMITYAKSLASPFPFVRVDLYEINGRLYFGELTFTPHGGMMSNLKDEILLKMGQLLQLPEKNTSRIPFLSA